VSFLNMTTGESPGGAFGPQSGPRLEAFSFE
jgi:hypothetical protein